MIPIIVLTSLKIGSLFTGGKMLPSKGEITQEFIKENLIQYLIGSFLLASIAAGLLGIGVYLLLKIKGKEV